MSCCRLRHSGRGAADLGAGERRSGLRHRRLHPCGGGLCFPRGVAVLGRDGGKGDGAARRQHPPFCRVPRGHRGGREYDRRLAVRRDRVLVRPSGQCPRDEPSRSARTSTYRTAWQMRSCCRSSRSTTRSPTTARYFKIFNYISPFKVDAGEFEPGLLPGAIRELCGEIGIRTASSRR